MRVLAAVLAHSRRIFSDAARIRPRARMEGRREQQHEIVSLELVQRILDRRPSLLETDGSRESTVQADVSASAKTELFAGVGGGAHEALAPPLRPRAAVRSRLRLGAVGIARAQGRRAGRPAPRRRRARRAGRSRARRSRRAPCCRRGRAASFRRSPSRRQAVTSHLREGSCDRAPAMLIHGSAVAREPRARPAAHPRRAAARAFEERHLLVEQQCGPRSRARSARDRIREPQVHVRGTAARAEAGRAELRGMPPAEHVALEELLPGVEQDLAACERRGVVKQNRERPGADRESRRRRCAARIRRAPTAATPAPDTGASRSPGDRDPGGCSRCAASRAAPPTTDASRERFCSAAGSWAAISWRACSTLRACPSTMRTVAAAPAGTSISPAKLAIRIPSSGASTSGAPRSTKNGFARSRPDATDEARAHALALRVREARRDESHARHEVVGGFEKEERVL